MKRLWLALPTAIVALSLVGVLGTAGADTTATPSRTLAVNGAGEREVRSDAAHAAFAAAYTAALDDAIADAKAKAAHVAERAGVTLGGIDSVAELSNSTLSGCYGAIAFDSAGASAPVAKNAPAAKHKKAKRKHKASASVAVAPDQSYPCQIQASVRISYTLAG
jgi:uncharacterized protein YggE